MNKKEIVASVAEMNDMEQKEVSLILDATLETIQDALAEGENVDFYGFGKFECKERSARKGRNPSTGESIDIPAKNVVSFKASKKLKDAVQ